MALLQNIFRDMSYVKDLRHDTRAWGCGGLSWVDWPRSSRQNYWCGGNQTTQAACWWAVWEPANVMLQLEWRYCGLTKKLYELIKVVDTQEIWSLECPRDVASTQSQCGFWTNSIMSWKNICIKNMHMCSNDRYDLGHSWWMLLTTLWIRLFFLPSTTLSDIYLKKVTMPKPTLWY